ncbi:MAG: transposase [Rubrobacteraceae bacterium]|jgi:transposase-like protein|nr:transposase [Rubrobacteraceae bacterium]
MKISLLVPEVNLRPTARPRACPYCKKSILHRHGTVLKPIKDHKIQREVEAHRYKCVSWGRTFRHYPNGVTSKDQSQRTVVLAALMYGLGLSCSAASHLLGALGAEVSQITVWRDAQEAGEALRRSRPAGRVRIASLGADETIFKVRGREVVVGFVVDAQSGKTMGFEVLFEGDGQAFKKWLEPYVKEFGVEVLVTDDNDSYGVAASELGLSHQLCIAHVRKYVKRRSKSILEQAEGEWGEQEEKYKKLEEDLKRLRGLLEELPEEGEKQIGQMHREYLWAQPPTRGEEGAKAKEKASCGYRMRMLTLELWNKWQKIQLYLRRPELSLDGTNNASERSIGRSKVRYKTMRGYKSVEGMSNGVVLTQWLYSGEDEHDLLAEVIAA